jgi:hypothetical protein
MAVIVNEFEVVPGQSAQPAAPAAPPPPPPDPALAEEELERALRHVQLRAERLGAV